MLVQSIQKCDVEIHKELYANMVMCGGSSMFKGFTERVQKQVKELAADSMTIKMIAHPERRIFAWIGGSILASLTHCWAPFWISTEEYNEGGPSIVHRRCT